MNILAPRPALYTLVCAGLVLAGARLYSDAARSAVEIPSPAAPPAPDQAIGAFIKSTEAALMSGHFDQLETEAQADRDVNVRFAGGYSKIRYFYRALGSFGRTDNCGCGKVMYSTDLTFGQKLHALDRWKADKPGSTAEAIAMAQLWQSLAWNARGHKMADMTPAENMNLFTRREPWQQGFWSTLTPGSIRQFMMSNSTSRAVSRVERMIIPRYLRRLFGRPQHIFSTMAQWPASLSHVGSAELAAWSSI